MTHVLNAGFVFHTRFKIVIHESVLSLLQQVHALAPNKTDEFGIYLKANLNLDEGAAFIYPVDVTTNENFIIPEQEVTPGSISFKEEAPTGYNAIIHRHPPGVTSFSGTDMNSINQEFAVSLVYIPPASFPDALINIRLTEDSFLQLRLKETDIEIRKKEPKVTDEFKKLVESKLKPKGLRLPAGVKVDSIPHAKSISDAFKIKRRTPFSGSVKKELIDYLAEDDDQSGFDLLAELDKKDNGI